MSISELNTKNMQISVLKLTPVGNADIFDCQMEAIALAARKRCCVEFEHNGKCYLITLSSLLKAVEVYGKG